VKGSDRGSTKGMEQKLLLRGQLGVYQELLEQMACLNPGGGFWHAIFVKRVSADQLQPFVTRPAGRLTLHSHLGNSGSETLVELGC
jgi:hypothetical protein